MPEVEEKGMPKVFASFKFHSAVNQMPIPQPTVLTVLTVKLFTTQCNGDKKDIKKNF